MSWIVAIVTIFHVGLDLIRPYVRAGLCRRAGAVAAGKEHAAAATAIEAIAVKCGSKLRLDHLRKLPPVFTAKGEKELSQNAQKLSQSAENMSQTVAFPVTEDYFGVT